MHRYCYHGRWIIWISFFIALILQIMPWPTYLYFFRPSWIHLLLIYWVMALPHRINIGISFILGLITDLILGSILGIRSLALSILTYIVACKYELLRNMIIWQQAFFVIWLSFITQLVIFCIKLLVINTTLHPEIFWSSIVDGILWPWLFFLMRKIRRKFSIQ